MTQALPSLFISHGAPNMSLSPSEVREFVSRLGSKYPKPAAIVVCSAHFETTGPAVVCDASPQMIYDFRGFEKELYEFQYPAPGEPALAERVAQLIEAEGMKVERVAKRGFDHGIWVPLSLIYPEADIPVVQLSIDPNETPDYHYRLGRAIASLGTENVLLIGSGNITHNLPALSLQGKDLEKDHLLKIHVAKFIDWFDARLGEGEVDALLGYRAQAPYAVENHPEDDHLLPIFFSMGAAGEKFRAEKLHESCTYGAMAMDAYEFQSA